MYNAIRGAIVGKVLPPGSTVTEAQLAKDLGVSKTPVREALLRLREVGLVQALATRGMKVIEPTREAVVRAYEVRSVLESATARFAAQRATSPQRDEIEIAASSSLEAARRYDATSFRELDHSFHALVWEAATNHELQRLAENAYALTAALRAMDAPSGGDSIMCAEQHVVIANAIRQRDDITAAEVASRHVYDVLSCVMPPTDGVAGVAVSPPRPRATSRPGEATTD
ncbi:MAG TPA: GntR family transcriptional regulator [Micromonospora sp.]|nr:GntR family transcriptional regulator [Micromonospora sp.]